LVLSIARPHVLNVVCSVVGSKIIEMFGSGARFRIHVAAALEEEIGTVFSISRSPEIHLASPSVKCLSEAVHVVGVLLLPHRNVHM
jgi:hypothetical protein